MIRRVIWRAITLAALVLVPCASAGANPLLSGYGGPGQGSQAIIGSQLLNGPSPAREVSAGAQTSPGSGTSSAAAREGGPANAGASTGQGAASGHAPNPPATPDQASRAGHGPGAAGTSRTQSSGGVHGAAATRALAFSQAAAVSSQPLGLSGGDILLIVLAFALVLLTGALTRFLKRPPR